MPNTFFKFKKFTVYQDQCAMKVCTDSCIFGAYLPVSGRKKILDIGAGTGLLSLMIAQRTSAEIDAVEVESSAYKQALQNILDSPWPDRIRIHHQAIQEYQKYFKQPEYDFILTNPPFYENYLKSSVEDRNTALHAQRLTFDELLEAVSQLLKKEGEWAVLLPVRETAILQRKAAEANFHLRKKLLIKNKEQDQVFRIVSIYAYQKKFKTYDSELMYIRNDTGVYSEKFSKVLKDYYLIF